MFEVKITFITDRGTWPITIATFEGGSNDSRGHARLRAIKFAKQIDKGFAVDVINVEDEDNREKAFGLVFHRDAEF